MAEITQYQAIQLAEQYLTTLGDYSRMGGLVLVAEATRETPYGWIFFYNSQRYLQTQDITFALGGNAPFLIEKQTGQAYVFGTARPVDDYLAAYVQRYVQKP